MRRLRFVNARGLICIYFNSITDKSAINFAGIKILVCGCSKHNSSCRNIKVRGILSIRLDRCLILHDDYSCKITARLFAVFHYDRGRLLAVCTVNRFTTLDPSLRHFAIEYAKVLGNIVAGRKKKKERKKWKKKENETSLQLL